jgi:hypothetical protein
MRVEVGEGRHAEDVVEGGFAGPDGVEEVAPGALHHLVASEGGGRAERVGL